MYTKQQQLEYLRKMQLLNQANILKDDIHLTYQYRNRKKAANNVHTLQDKIQEEVAQRTLDGDYPNRADIRSIQRDNNFDETVENIVDELLVNERKRIHRDDSKFIDKVVEDHTTEYTKFLKNRLTIESQRVIEKVIIIEGKALEAGATPAQARQQAMDYVKTHGKGRTKNIIKDAVHSQECNVSFIQAVEEGYRYKVWMNGNRKGNTRAWHIAKTIDPVPVDEPFEIYGPRGKKLSMYPGDLQSGAENVANCKCWLRYTNRKPERLNTKYNIPEGSYLRDDDTQRTSVSFTQKVRTAISDTSSKVKTTVKDVASGFRKRFGF